MSNDPDRADVSIACHAGVCQAAYWGLSATELDDMRRLIGYLGPAVPEGIDEDEGDDEE